MGCVRERHLFDVGSGQLVEDWVHAQSETIGCLIWPMRDEQEEREEVCMMVERVAMQRRLIESCVV